MLVKSMYLKFLYMREDFNITYFVDRIGKVRKQFLDETMSGN